MKAISLTRGDLSDTLMASAAAMSRRIGQESAEAIVVWRTILRQNFRYAETARRRAEHQHERRPRLARKKKGVRPKSSRDKWVNPMR